MSPNVAAEIMGADMTETASFNKLEKEILVRVNKHKAHYQSLNPAPAHSPAEGSASPTASSAGSFRFEKRTLPRFGGTLREYPTFMDADFQKFTGVK